MNVTDSAKKLAGYVEQANFWKSLIFGALWVFLALTTFVYGAQHIYKLWHSVTGFIPVSAAASLVIAQNLAGGSAVLVFDGGYRAWAYIKLNHSETSVQYWLAASMEWISAGGSWFMTLVVLFQVFPEMLGVDLVNWLGAAGAVIFIVVSVLHGIAMFIFKRNATDVRKQATQALLNGLHVSEQLAFEKNVQTQALTTAKSGANNSALIIAAMQAQLWEADMAESLLAKINDESLRAGLREQYRQIALEAGPPPPSSNVGQPKSKLRQMLDKWNRGEDVLAPEDPRLAETRYIPPAPPADYETMGNSPQPSVNGTAHD